MPQPDLVEMIVLGEAANQGEEGMRMVLETMRNRSRRRGTDYKTEATRRKQYTAASRADLPTFYGQQPEEVRALANRLHQEVQAEDYEPRYLAPEGFRDPDHYMTKELFYSDKRPDWVDIDKFVVVDEIGDHVLLAKPR